MMGIMVPETCGANNKFCNKEPSVTSSWPFNFHVLTTIHGQTHITAANSFKTQQTDCITTTMYLLEVTQKPSRKK